MTTPLVFVLKAKERIMVNGAIFTTDKKTTLKFENKVEVVLGKFLVPVDAPDTPFFTLWLSIQNCLNNAVDRSSRYQSVEFLLRHYSGDDVPMPELMRLHRHEDYFAIIRALANIHKNRSIDDDSTDD